VNKTEPKNLLVSYKALPLPSALKKRGKFFTKQVDFHAKRFDFSRRKMSKNLVEIKWPLPLHSVQKNGVQKAG
jgi:hypothetical protein